MWLSTVGSDDKRLHLFHVITRAGEDTPTATGEHMLVHVDSAAGRASPVRDGVRQRVEALAAAHAPLPRPAARVPITVSSPPTVSEAQACRIVSDRPAASKA
jgi:carnitine 3-dehydrogenase / betainyl-CoA thioesterase